MNAFLKYDISLEPEESLEDYYKRCQLVLDQVTLLSNEELLRLSRKELVALHSLNYARYLALKNPSFPKIYTKVKEGDILSVPFYTIFPRRMCDEYLPPSEWDRADIGCSETIGPIEVIIFDGRKLIVYDGHNRLKDAIAASKELITVKVKEILRRGS
jgi:hypothetical protein